VPNYKLLQIAFTKPRIQRYVDVDKLIRAKYQGNLEFCKWLMAYFVQVGRHRDDNYDPSAVRARGKGGVKFNEAMGLASKGRGGGVAAAALPKAKPKGVSQGVTHPMATTKAERVSRPCHERVLNPFAFVAASSPFTPPNKHGDNPRRAAGLVVCVTDDDDDDGGGGAAREEKCLCLKKRNQDLLTDVKDLKLKVRTLKKERNFFMQQQRVTK
jgi:hypothetical protein